jgi:hypothetical protein
MAPAKPPLLARLPAALLAGAVAAALACGLPSAAAAAPDRPAEARPGWTRSCSGGASDRQCLLTLRQSYANNRGGRNELTVGLRRGPSCVTLHVTFDAPIDLDMPASIAVDGGGRHDFYTERDLTRLARAVDARQPPSWGPAEFRRFYAEVEAGGVRSVGTELVARFARVKESRRLALACAATERLLPELAGGRSLAVEFHVESKGGSEPYHWPRMTARRVLVPLEGMLHALDSAGLHD